MKRRNPGWGLSLLPTRDRVVRRRSVARGTMPLMPELLDAGGGGGGGGGGDDDDKLQLTDELKASDPGKYWRVYWKRETKAAEAFGARDEVKRKIADLEKRKVLTPEQEKEYETLKTQAAKLEEERKRKEGEFDNWRADINKAHTEELSKREERLKALERQIAEGEVSRAFLGATDYFGGGETSKTVLVGQMAVNALGRYVSYEDYDFGGDDGKKPVLVVRDSKGAIIRGQDGRPAPFGEAVDRLIKSLPEKDHILRGSGKSGSGARGEGVLDDKGNVDLSKPLTPEQARDPKVRAQLETIGGSGLQMGRGFKKAAALTSKP